MKPETRRLLGFGALAVGAHFLLLLDGFYRSSSRAYLNPRPLRVVLARPAPVATPLPIRQAVRIASPLVAKKPAVNPEVPAAPVAAIPIQQDELPPSSQMSERPDVDVPAQLLDDIVLPLQAMSLDGEAFIEVRLWINESGHVSRAEVIRSTLAEGDEASVIRQLVAARFVPAYKDGKPVASILSGGLSAD